VSSNQPTAGWDGALMVTRRQVLGILAGSAVASAVARPAHAAASLHYGYAAITWGNDYMTAISEIAATGYRRVQLRAGDGLLDRFGDKPAALRELLDQQRLAFPVFSSGNLSIDPAREKETIALHTQHAAFVHAAGGRFLQVIDERPKGRAVTADDYNRARQLTTELGKRGRAGGRRVGYP